MFFNFLAIILWKSICNLFYGNLYVFNFLENYIFFNFMDNYMYFIT